MNICKIKLLLERICEQERAKVDGLVMLFLQETVTNRMQLFKSVCGTEAIGVGK